jgi:ABC-2 type transport system ATP-binding protein
VGEFMKALYCSSLSKNYNTNRVLNNINLTIEENKIVGLIGRNGVGKTTLLKICAGHLLPTKGEVKVYDEFVFNNLKVLSNLVFIGNEMPYDKFMKLSDIMQLGKDFYENWDQTVADEILKQFDLKGSLKYGDLSTGMKTQFNIVMGLSTRAKLTIFDEPTQGLDIAVRKKLYELILNEYMEFPRTIVLSSHLLSEIENILEEVVFMNKGEVLLHKSIEEMQAYAMYLSGKKDNVLDFIQNKNIIHIEDFGSSVKAVIKNDLKEKEISSLCEKGVTVSKVPLEDIFVYLTENKERGNFNDSKSNK